MRKGFLKRNSLPILSFCKSHFGLQLSSNSLNSSGAEPELNPCATFLSDQGDDSHAHVLPRQLNLPLHACLFGHAGGSLQTYLAARSARHPRPDLLLRLGWGRRGREAHGTGAAQPPTGISVGGGSPVVAYLVRDGRFQVWNVRCPAPPEAHGGSALLGTGREGCFTGGSRDQAARIRGNAVLCRDGGRDDRPALRTARGEPQCRARRGARTRTSPAGQGSGHGSCRCRSKQDGVRLLQHAIDEGVLTQNVARFYLALNLHRYDQQYEKALAVIGPLLQKYP